MPYIDRDEEGRIVSRFERAQWDGQEFADVAELYSPPPAPPPYVTMRQARLALLHAGLLSAVNEAIANMEGVEGDAARIEWGHSQEVHRDKALLQALAPTLNLTKTQLDDLFLAAAAL